MNRYLQVAQEIESRRLQRAFGGNWSKEKPMAKTIEKKNEAEVIDEGKLLPHLQSVQVAVMQSDPPVVPLVKPGKEEDEAPPRAPKAKPTPVPRVVHQNERAPQGLVRFKIRCLNYGSDQPTRYILAASEEDARRCYLECTGISAVLKAVEDDGETPPGPRLSVTRLAD